MPDEPSNGDDEERLTDKRRGVIVSVPRGIRELMRDRNAETRITFTDLALDAVEDQVAQLPKVFEAEAPTQRLGKIFARTAYHNQRGSRREDEVTINLQLLGSDIDILDKMWKEAGARNRNHYLATALRLYLQPQSSGGAP